MWSDIEPYLDYLPDQAEAKAILVEGHKTSSAIIDNAMDVASKVFRQLSDVAVLCRQSWVHSKSF